MIRKHPRVTRGSRASTSSAPAATSPPPKDPLALGRHLVRELGLDDSNDTLGRWLAHEVAGLIHDAEHAESARDRARARREAVRVTTMLWAHRADLPGRAYPLAPFRHLLGAISLFTEDDRGPWWGSRRQGRDQDELAAAVFRGFGRLMPLLLLLDVAPSESTPPASGPAVDALGNEERALLQALRGWFDSLTPDPAESGEDARAAVRVVVVDQEDDKRDGAPAEGAREDETPPDGAGQLDPARLRSAALQVVDALTRDLATVRALLVRAATGAAGGDDESSVD